MNNGLSVTARQQIAQIKTYEKVFTAAAGYSPTIGAIKLFQSDDKYLQSKVITMNAQDAERNNGAIAKRSPLKSTPAIYIEELAKVDQDEATFRKAWIDARDRLPTDEEIVAYLILPAPNREQVDELLNREYEARLEVERLEEELRKIQEAEKEIRESLREAIKNNSDLSISRMGEGLNRPKLLELDKELRSIIADEEFETLEA